jgi:hypothetical protein
MKEQENFEKLVAMLTKKYLGMSLAEGGEESPIDNGGSRNNASEKENKASQDLH